MLCKNCGTPIKDGDRFCGGCGAPVRSGGLRRRTWIAIVIAAIVLIAVIVGVIAAVRHTSEAADEKNSLSQMKDAAQVKTEADTENEEAAFEPEPVGDFAAVPERLQFIDLSADDGAEPVAACVSPYALSEDLSEIINCDQFYLSGEQERHLQNDLFVVSESWSNEFFEVYEQNRYSLTPNFVTVDSMMHTYHLYFSHLLQKTEREYLSGELLALTKDMLTQSLAQYDDLQGTDWQKSAQRNVAYFAVANALLDESFTPPADVQSLVSQELHAIYAAEGIQKSPLTGAFVDYSQFIVRGYYEGDEVLEPYFRAMMWYGQINFVQSEDALNRSALLMTLAMQKHFDAWQRLYTTTSFFAGVSDDLGYYEYLRAIQDAYGGLPSARSLPGNDDAYAAYVEAIQKLSPPAVNSVPVMQTDEGDLGEMNKGFRFMGQRFSLDAAVMQQLVYRAVGENGEGDVRLLPDTLDVMAALGSDLAADFLDQCGATDYEGYTENLCAMREIIEATPEGVWSSSLYSSWLYTLKPLLTPKGEGYPSFMQRESWSAKDLETFAGSYTELKHDTVLYSKQVMAEMGGGVQERDDRGYVEPEVEVYRRFAALASQTAQGLSQMGILTAQDAENLTRLSELASRLEQISRKELLDETLTDDEYELIRAFGGTLEHFWIEAMQDETESEWLSARELPAPVVTDIATDPNGTVLQIATGRPARIYVVVPVDGTLRIACGAVYNFYQFESPMGARMTDSGWRQQIGVWQRADGGWMEGSAPAKPAWTRSYWVEQRLQ